MSVEGLRCLGPGGHVPSERSSYEISGGGQEGGQGKKGRLVNYEMNFIVTKSRFVILLIIFTGAFLCLYVNEEEADDAEASRLLPSVFNESVIAGLDKWWEKMFCSKFKYFFPFFHREQPKIMLDEFLVDVLPHKEEFRNIYMIENNCKSSLSWRMRCSAESVARANANATLFIITVSDHLDDEGGALSKWLTVYPNVVPVRLNINRLFFGTPLQRFSSQKTWTKIPVFMHAHVSDAMRLALVWRTGGTYYDSDIIAVRGLPLEDNVYMLESYFRVVNAFLKSKRRHPLLEEALQYFSKHYNKRKWDSNGPALLTTLVQDYCRTKDVIPGRCKDIMIVGPTEGIQPLHWKQIKDLFRDVHLSSKINETVFKNSYGVHFNNHLTSTQVIYFEKDTHFNRLMKEYCPFSYQEWKKETENDSWRILK